MKRRARVETYQDAAAEWRWSLVASNGRLIACSGEGYETKAGLRKALRRLTALDVNVAFHMAWRDISPEMEEEPRREA